MAIQHALDAGVRVGLGTDLLGETQPAQSEELLLRRVQSPLDVLRSATLVNAELLGKAGEPVRHRTRSSQPTSCSSSGDPLADLSVLVEHETSMRLVIRAGEILLERERP